MDLTGPIVLFGMVMLLVGLGVLSLMALLVVSVAIYIERIIKKKANDKMFEDFLLTREAGEFFD